MFKHSFKRGYSIFKMKSLRKEATVAYRRRNGTTAKAVGRSCARCRPHHLLLPPWQLLLFFFLSFTASLPFTLAAFDFSLSFCLFFL